MSNRTKQLGKIALLLVVAFIVTLFITTAVTKSAERVIERTAWQAKTNAQPSCIHNLHPAKGTYKLAKAGWNHKSLEKNGKRIKRVRHRYVCPQSKKAKKHIKHVMKNQKKRYKKAKKKAETPTYGALSPPGEAYLASLRACESGGNYQTNTGNGFYGAYQFDLGTWASVGGSGLPSSASSGEQDYRASLLYQERGSSPWPTCG